MTVEMANVIDGLYSRLTGDSTFNTAMGGTASAAGRVYYGAAPRETDFPFAVINIVDGVFVDTMSDDGYEYRVQVSLYDHVSVGARAVGVHGDTLRLRMHGQTPTATGEDPMTLVEDTTRGPFVEGDAIRFDADYLVRGYES